MAVLIKIIVSLLVPLVACYVGWRSALPSRPETLRRIQILTAVPLDESQAVLEAETILREARHEE